MLIHKQMTLIQLVLVNKKNEVRPVPIHEQMTMSWFFLVNQWNGDSQAIVYELLFSDLLKCSMLRANSQTIDSYESIPFSEPKTCNNISVFSIIHI